MTMEASDHGGWRIFDRTKMCKKDVLSVIENNGAFELGTANKRRFFLLYSPFDKDCKIAIVSEDLRVLVTVWNKNYHIPVTITQVNKRSEDRARIALRRYIFDKIKSETCKNGKSKFYVKIDVYEGETIVYEHNEIEICPEDVYSKWSVLDAARPIMLKIVGIVEENKNNLNGRVRYGFRILNPKTSLLVVKPYILDHKMILSKLEEAT